MEFRITDVSEEAAYNALAARENFPEGTRAHLTYVRLIDADAPEAFAEYTFRVYLPEREPLYSIEHPYEGVAMASSQVASPILALGIPGYAASHAPTPEAGQKIGNKAMFLRHFDRKGGGGYALSTYKGCMTGGRR